MKSLEEMNTTKGKGTTREAGEEKIVAIEGRLRKEKILVLSLDEIQGLSSRGYGLQVDEEFTLNFCEALYLSSKGIFEIKDSDAGKALSFQDLLREYRLFEENAWVKYLIYRDLRSRGYVVRDGFGLGIDFRVYERGEYGRDTADYLILGVLEGRPVSVEDLAQALSHAQNLKKNLVLAVLNRKGEIVYYSFSRLSFD